MAHPAAALLAALAHRAQQAAVLALHLDHEGELRGGRQPATVTGGDPGDRRVDEHLGPLAADASACELEDGLLGAVRRAARERLEREAKASAEAHRAEPEERARRLGNLPQAAALEDEAARGGGARVDQALRQAEIGDERAHRRLAIEEAVRPALDDEAVLDDRLDVAPDGGRRLDHDGPGVGAQAIRQAESGDPRADDGDAPRRHTVRLKTGVPPATRAR